MKLSILKSMEVIRRLKKINFFIDHQKGSHITMLNEKNNRRVTIPFHNKDLKKGTLKSILRQAGTSAEEFNRLNKN
ncbi:type II toxin-antitoxin system HicA family toxin [Patescibacteria group bacterium]|nr:type II toxin-antitoxin system HicA family toxin [Patescibacteria group bacterium]